MVKNRQIIQKLRDVKLKRSQRGKFNRISGHLYTFKYSSATATDPIPLVITVSNGSKRLWTAENGNSYMSGISIGGLPPFIQGFIIRKLANKRRITYRVIKAMDSALKAKYRNYRFSKVHNLHLVDRDIYLEVVSPQLVGEDSELEEGNKLSAKVGFRDIQLNYLKKVEAQQRTNTRLT